MAANRLSAIVLTYKRPDELTGALESLLTQRPLPDEILVYDDDPQGSGRQADGVDHPLVRYVCIGHNLGPAGARTRAAAEASGDILLFLDDDCRLADTLATAHVREAFAQHAQAAILTFLIRNAQSLQILPWEYPGYSQERWNEPHEVGYFLAGAFAIRRHIFLEIGGFDDALFHGEEEVELSFRLVNTGWRLRYEPAVLVYHRASPLGRDTIRRSYQLVRNRVYLAVKHLPFPYVLSHLMVWGGFTFLQALRKRELREFARGIASLRRDGLLPRARQYRREHPMTREALQYFRQHEGRLWY